MSNVERILNMNWNKIMPPPKGAGHSNYMTAVTEITEYRAVSSTMPAFIRPAAAKSQRIAALDSLCENFPSFKPIPNAYFVLMHMPEKLSACSAEPNTTLI